MDHTSDYTIPKEEDRVALLPRHIVSVGDPTIKLGESAPSMPRLEEGVQVPGDNAPKVKGYGGKLEEVVEVYVLPTRPSSYIALN